MFKKINQGFTVAELLSVIMLFCVTVVITIGVILQQDKLRERQITKKSRLFYANVMNAYHQILLYNSTNGIITAIEDRDKNGKQDSEDLRNLFNYYMDGENTECSGFGIDLTDSALPAKYIKNAVCSTHSGNMIAGYFFDADCKTEVKVKETYTSDNKMSRIVKDACGNIIYGQKSKKAKGIIGVDVFTTAIGKIGVK